MKLKLNSGGMKQFFLTHGEKLALTVAGVLFVLFCWSSYSTISTDSFDKTPTDLDNLVSAARQHIANAKPELDKEDPPVVLPQPQFSQQIQEMGRDKVDPKVFRQISWNYPLFDHKTRRGEPEYLPVEKLRVASNHGALALKDKTARGHDWVVVTGLVPVAKQEAIYEGMFRDALIKSNDRDHPRYLRADVERALVDPSNPDADPEWKPLNFARVADVYRLFEKPGEDSLAEEHVDPAFTMPLPPLAKKQHGAEVAHADLGASTQPVAEEPVAEEPVEAAPMEPMGFGAFGAFGAGEEKKEEQTTSSATTAAGPAGPVNARLFRVFDFDVRPLESYRYRVRVALQNPNKGLAPQFVQEPELSQGDERWSPWSEPSPIVTVPGIFDLWLAQVDAGRGNNESEATLVVRKWDTGHAAEVVHRFTDLLRGKHLDITTQASVPDPMGNGANSKNVVFDTGRSLLDMTGGDALPISGKPIRSPGEVLVMGPNGELTILTQLADAGAVNAAQQEITRAPKSGAAPAEKKEEPAAADPFDIFKLNSSDE